MESPNPKILVTEASPETSMSDVATIEQFSKKVHDVEHDLKIDFVDLETITEDIDDKPPEKLEILQHAFDKASQQMEYLQKFASEACLKLAAGRRALEHRVRDQVHLRKKPGRTCDSGISLVSSLGSNFQSQTLSETNSSPVMSPTDSVDDYQSTTASHQAKHGDKESLSRSLSDSEVESDNGVRPEIGAMSDTGPVTFNV